VPDTGHRAGWRVDVLVGELPVLIEAAEARPVPARTAITVEGRERWRVAAVEPADGEFGLAQEHVLTAPGLPADDLGFACARRGAELTGAVRLAVVDEHLYVSRLSVDEGYRRDGLGTALMAAAGHWATGRGARWCVLQVADHNTAAHALYQRLGCTVHHRYRYLVPPGAAQAG
jgi:ribosomal protein S18 acetylase RimI-like enzyme